MNTATQEETKPQTAPVVETPREYISPGVNIVETKDGYFLEAEMPGVNKDGLDIHLEENVLTLVGRRSQVPLGTSLYRESRAADFRRVFEVDPSIDTQKISARIDQGIVTLSLPKAEKVKPRKITVG